MANRDFEPHLGCGCLISLRRPADATARFRDLNFEVTTGHQFVEMMAGDVGVKVDLAPRRVAKRRGDGREGRGKFGWAQLAEPRLRGSSIHAGILAV